MACMTEALVEAMDNAALYEELKTDFYKITNFMRNRPR